MTLWLFLEAVVAGIIYVIVPGPATLAVLGLSASHGRGRAALFLAAHFAGDVVWSVLALAALLGASRLGPELFHLLGLACGGYLIYVGVQAIRTRRGAGGAAEAVGAASPLRTGLLFGLTNPKAYPFALAMFGALAVEVGGGIALREAVFLLIGTSLGIAMGGFFTIYWTGLAPISRLFGRFRVGLVRAAGVLFVLIGAKTAWDAAAALRRG
ncbi:LysE family translocator [Methyloraptor flagellatus]|uniref:LysE family transporter n=1 Tax=Methyloraptor flagellatus TaxID=3162530 RepID=A0AAU7XFZ8_9HYPH